jgi:hypothetical protein
MLPEYDFDYRKARPNRFVENTPSQKKQEVSDLNEASVTHLEEEFSNYKERYPREQEIDDAEFKRSKG